MKCNIKALILLFGFIFSYAQVDTTNTTPIINYLLQTERTYPSSYFPSYKSPYASKEEVNPFPNVQINGIDSFPMIWYDAIAAESVQAQSEAIQRISEIAGTGANGIVTYFGSIAAYYLDGTIPTNSFINQYFDEADNHNLSVLLGINVTLICNYVHGIEKTKNLKRIMNYITHYSQRDNLLGWYLYDEPSIGEYCKPPHPDNKGKYKGTNGNPIPIDSLITLYHTIKDTLIQLGKSHQNIFMVDIARSNQWSDKIAPNRPKGWTDSENNIDNARYSLATDYAMWDHYPSGDEIIGVPLAQDQTTEAISQIVTKPILPVLLAENEIKRFFNTDPNNLGECQRQGITNKQECFEKMYFEQRYALYSSIVHGARGIFHYIYRFSDQEIINNITALYSEFKYVQFQKMLLLPPPSTTSLLYDYKFDRDNNGMNDLNYILRELNGKYYVIAINDSKVATGSVHFRLLNKDIQSVSVLENQSISNTLSVQHQNVFGDSFKPFEVKIYEITTTP